MIVRLPTFTEALNVARGHGCDSEAPDKWDSLIGLWSPSQGGGSTWFDLSGFDFNGTLTNGPTWTSTKNGAAIDFVPGSSHYVALPARSRLEQVMHGDVTFSFVTEYWPDVVTNAASQYFTFIGLYSSAGDYLRMLHRCNYGTNSLELHLYDDYVALWPNQAVTFPTASVPYHVGFVWDGANINYYLDGVYQGQDAVVFADFSEDAITTAALGRSNATNYLDGKLGQTMLYERALSASEIQELSVDPYALLRQRVPVFGAAAVGFDTDLASLINLGSPWYQVLPYPSGSLGQGNRQHFLSLYSGILAGAAAGVTLLDYERGFGRGISRGYGVGMN